MSGLTIASTGVAKDGRGRVVHIVATNLPGPYSVLGVQLLNSGKGVSKDGRRTYTPAGKFYKNGGRTSDALDLISFEAGESEIAGAAASSKVTMVYSLAGEDLASREVDRDSDEHEQLTADGWSESDASA
jgi:hypothetical protein